MSEIRLQPIGKVKNSIINKEHHGWQDIVSEITINDDFVPALDGLADFSHIIVIFWLHGVSDAERTIKRARPLQKAEMPELGIFAWHSSRRPNPIGVSIVKLLGVEKGKVLVQGLDAIDGTPVLDLRPYAESYYHVDDPRGPSWVELTKRGRR